MNMETNHHMEWSNDGTQQQKSCRPERARSAGHQRALGRKGRANTTLRGTLSAGSHTGVFPKKVEAEIRDWRQWFCLRQHLENYQQKQNIRGEEKEREELWELQIRFMLFPLWEHLNQCSNHHFCPSSLEYLVICLLLYSNPHGSHGNARRRETSIPQPNQGKGSSRWKEQEDDGRESVIVSSINVFHHMYHSSRYKYQQVGLVAWPLRNGCFLPESQEMRSEGRLCS